MSHHFRKASWVTIAVGAVLTALSVFPTKEALTIAAGSIACSIATRFLARRGY